VDQTIPLCVARPAVRVGYCNLHRYSRGGLPLSRARATLAVSLPAVSLTAALGRLRSVELRLRLVVRAMYGQLQRRGVQLPLGVALQSGYSYQRLPARPGVAEWHARVRSGQDHGASVVLSLNC